MTEHSPKLTPKPFIADAAWLAAFVILACLTSFRWQGVVSDDAMIALRYARNILAGHGWVYNIGERVNGVTSALNTLLLVGFGAITFPDMTRAATLAYIFGASGAAFFTYLIFRSRSRWIGGWAGSMVTLMGILAPSAGLESPLNLMFVAASAFFYMNGRYARSSVALGLLFLTRPDGALFALILILHYVLTKETLAALNARLIAKCAAIFLVIVAPWLIFSWLYFGSIVPNTVGIKVVQGRTDLGGGDFGFWNGLIENFDLFTLNAWAWFGWRVYAVLAALGVLISFIQRRGRPLIAIWLFAYFVVYQVSNFPPHFWYYIPLHYGLIFYCAVALEWIWNEASKLPIKTTRTMRATLAMGAVLLLQPCLINPAQKAEPPWPHYREAAQWLAENSPPNSIIACAEIGVIGYGIGDRQIADMHGLVNAEGKKWIAQWAMDWWYDFYKPDFIIFHDPLWSAEQDVGESDDFQDHYECVKKIDAGEKRRIEIYERKPDALKKSD